MKKQFAARAYSLSLAVLFAQALSVGAITFTNDTVIGINNTNYEGADIAVTNCTVTVDGVHSFASLQVLNAGVLTHTFSTNGLLENRISVTNEQHVLSVSNAAPLNYANVDVTTIVVQDLSASVTYSNGADYLVGLDTNGFTTILLTTNSAILDGTTNLVSYDVTNSPVSAGIKITIAGDASVEIGGKINTDGKGFGGGQGPGAGTSTGSPVSGGGGGHGGYGGQSAGIDGSGRANDGIAQPANLGSGGGTGLGGDGGSGGGSIKLTVGGTLRVDGMVSANGANGINDRSGGGAGGTIWLSAQNFMGAGSLFASGGSGEPTQGGGGGGGRISLQYTATTFSGAIAARGGAGYMRGGAGTIYTRTNGQLTGQVLADNGGKAGMTTWITDVEAFAVTVQGGAVIALQGPRTFGSLVVSSNSWVSLTNQALTVSGNATIQAGGGITADSTGSIGGQGSGAGKYSFSTFGYTGGGGGYGGYGAMGGGPASYGGTTYGTITPSFSAGSGGGCFPPYGFGGSGGGLVNFTVNGTLLLDGRISADGGAGLGEGSGGGSGGGIAMTVGTIAGAGTISASGGAGNGSGLAGGGGGGGGRIAIGYTLNLFFGITTARGGTGSTTGGAGTIYSKASTQQFGAVLVDNAGQSGTNTTWNTTAAVDLTVSGGGVVSLPSSQTLNSLLVASNSWLWITNFPMIVSGNATIQSSGGILADGTGNPGNQGAGAGHYVPVLSSYFGGGGGYGGYGGSGAAASQSSPLGGNSYGSLTVPIDLGSGGGGIFNNTTAGGSGGGAIRLTVNGTLQVEGRISANGMPGIAASAGGGSGGSLILNVGTLAGAGVIAANGGAGNSLGGGGGGGRIAITYNGYAFAGNVSAYGGPGFVAGGAGTIYTKANSQSNGRVVLDNGGQSGTNTTWSSSPSVDLVVQGGAVFSLPTSQTLSSLFVGSNAWVNLGSQTATVSGNATIQEGGGIIADGAGYAGGQGPGAGRFTSGTGGGGGGGGYGGYGAAGALSTSLTSGGIPYGNLTGPIDLGSGGGIPSSTVVGGAGGGAIRLNVTGTLALDGIISANGQDGNSSSGGGGSGGSIWLNVGTISGSGRISANGGMGSGSGSGGGGGRIAIQYNTYAFGGQTTAYGGGGYDIGGAGTIYTKASSQSSGLVVLDNGGQSGTNTTWTATGTIDLTVRGGAVLSPPSSQNFGTLLVASNSWISVTTQNQLASASTATIQAGGGIIADGTGNPAGQGTGHGISYPLANGYVGGGGGYGGYGAAGGGVSLAYGGSPFGSITEPTDLGSGGGTTGAYAMGGAGGGVIHLSVTGALQVDGVISANGLPAVTSSAGGGSGGSISLGVGTLTGSGMISANGGAGLGLGGGGGGGRIAITYTANVFSGLISAYGGGGYGIGGAGTVYIKANNQSSARLVLDNGGQAGTNTTWNSAGTVDLTLKGGAVFSSSTSQTIGSLLVSSNSWIVLTAPSGSGPTFTITSNAVVQAGGGILADGTGYGSLLGNNGPGAGGTASTSSGGGGHGGYGASSGGSPSGPGGNIYDSLTQPSSAGSSGGTLSSSFGGAGGGVIRLNVTGILQVDGRVSAVGKPGISSNFGGGAGGSIWLTAGTLAGSGVISADGGAGNGLGGGGGGGRIALQYSANTFSGVLSAIGGSGYSVGGAGTIYSKANNQASGLVVADNGGQSGTNTSFTSTSGIDLTVTGGAVVTPPGPQTFGNLLITSNGWLSIATQTLTVTSNASVQAGGGIIADRTGFTGGQGIGAGRSASSSGTGPVGGGGGYGGYGAASAGPTVALGGAPNGSPTAPVDRGSGGGYSTASLAGSGGGAIRITVTGALLVNGRISANGGAGLGQGAGGGSGGSVYLTVGTLAGAGTISANGGAGNQLGGGGSGGCIALLYSASVFDGSVSAYGGGGFNSGAAGTIYTKANNQITGQFLVDNGGINGTNTPIPYLTAFDLTVRNGGVAYPATSYLLLSNLNISAGGTITSLRTQTNLDLVVLRNVTADAGGSITVDGKGYALGAGPGAGLSTNSIGSGAGYGGLGGASSVLPGGTNYGSAQQPVDRGSGGGTGGGPPFGGSDGGGAIRLTVGGSVLLNGRLSAGGNAALEDDGGGGSGGSIWLSAGILQGTGAIAADGGAGQLYNGGGGGGGRIALYPALNAFGGSISALGGAGASPGSSGSIFSSTNFLIPQVISSMPTGIVNSTVSSVDISFNTPVNPYTVSPVNVGVITPAGPLNSGSLSTTSLSPSRFRISFPSQSAQGTYLVTVGPQIQNLYGQAMSQVYTGAFSIVWPAVSGTVTDTNGQPVAGVLMQPDGGNASTLTDTNGNYSLQLPPVGVVTVVPSLNNLVFVPGSRSYSNLGGPIPNENYLAVPTIVPVLSAQAQTNNLLVNWYGISGVTYQPFYSTNLVDWFLYGGPIAGTNGVLQIASPMDTDPTMFFYLKASN